MLNHLHQLCKVNQDSLHCKDIKAKIEKEQENRFNYDKH